MGSLSNLADDLSEGIHKIKHKDSNCFHNYESVKHNLINCNCLSCNKNYSNKIDENFKNWFKSNFKFSADINKFILFLRKDVYPYKYMNDLEKFNETSLPGKEEFYSNLNIEDIMDLDYNYAERICKDFELKNLG